MKYYSLAVLLLLQTTSVVEGKHHLKQHSSSKQQAPTRTIDLQSNADHLDDDEEVNERLTNKKTPAPAPAAEPESKPDTYPSPDKKDLANMKNLFEFSKRAVTDNGTDKDHHEYNPWANPSDYHGFDMRAAKEQMTEVTVLKTGHRDTVGRHCLPFDFFTIQYKGYMQDGSNMVQVLDSRKINKGKPITF